MNLTSALQAIKLVIGLLPLIASFVKQVEEDLAGFAGTAKLQAVVAAVETYLAKAETAADIIKAVEAQLGPVIASLVAAYNAAGLFKKAAPSTLAAAH